MIKEIELRNFRIFSNIKIDCDYNTIILTGENGTGKTSILEAIHINSTSKSHRTSDVLETIKTNEEFSTIKIKTNKEYKIVLSKSAKNYFINNVSTKTKDYIGKNKCVCFSPTDLELITGGKNVRRHFIDLENSVLNDNYLIHLSNYKKILKERNEFLKTLNEVNEIMLNVLTDSLIIENEIIYKERIKFIDCLNEELKKIGPNFSNESIKIKYIPSYDPSDIKNSFYQKKKMDLYNKTTNIGVHRDDFQILVNGQDSSVYASQGQKRTAVIAIKLALKEFIIRKYQEYPVLLLDDVFAELDSSRQNKLMEYLFSKSQTFITTTSILNLPDNLLKEAKVINLKKENIDNARK